MWQYAAAFGILPASKRALYKSSRIGIFSGTGIFKIVIIDMTDTFVNDTFLIILQTVLSSGNQITQGNDKIGLFSFKSFLIPLMA